MHENTSHACCHGYAQVGGDVEGIVHRLGPAQQLQLLLQPAAAADPQSYLTVCPHPRDEGMHPAQVMRDSLLLS